MPPPPRPGDLRRGPRWLQLSELETLGSADRLGRAEYGGVDGCASGGADTDDDRPRAHTEVPRRKNNRNTVHPQVAFGEGRRCSPQGDDGNRGRGAVVLRLLPRRGCFDRVPAPVRPVPGPSLRERVRRQGCRFRSIHFRSHGQSRGARRPRSDQLHVPHQGTEPDRRTLGSRGWRVEKEPVLMQGACAAERAGVTRATRVFDLGLGHSAAQRLQVDPTKLDALQQARYLTFTAYREAG